MTPDKKAVLVFLAISIVALGAAFGYRYQTEKAEIARIEAGQEWAGREFKIVDSPTANELIDYEKSPWGALGLLSEKQESFINRGYDEAYSVTSTMGKLTVVYREDVVTEMLDGESCRFYVYSLSVDRGGLPKRFDLGKSSFGESENCRKENPEMRWSFQGLTADGTEAWIVTVPPFPIGDVLSGEIGVGNHLLRVSLENGFIKEMSVGPAFIQRVDVKHALLLLQNHENCKAPTPIEGWGCYSVLEVGAERAYPAPALWHGMQEDVNGVVFWHVDVQTSFSADGKSVAFVTLSEGHNNETQRAEYQPMKLWVLDIATGKHRDVPLGIGANDVFLVKEWKGARALTIDYIDWTDEGQEIKSRTISW